MTQTEPEDDEEVSEALLPCCYFMTPILISKHRALCFQGKRRRDEKYVKNADGNGSGRGATRYVAPCFYPMVILVMVSHTRIIFAGI